MSINKTYSKRNKKFPDIFIYDKLPEKLRNQVFHIWDDFCSANNLTNPSSRNQYAKSLWNHVYKTILKEEGKKSLTSHGHDYSNPRNTIEEYFDELQDVDKCLDIIELVFTSITIVDSLYTEKLFTKINYTALEAIEDLNYRFKENGVGFQFENNVIIRVDSAILHGEVIKPALKLLSDTKFKNANEEFMKAFNHFKYRRYHETLNECLKSFESTLKIICKLNNWSYKETDTAKKLIDIVQKNKLFSSYHQSKISAIRQLLESSIPTIRNKNSGHGQGVDKIIVPENLASYMLYMTGSTIKFLIDTNENNNR